MKCMAVGWYDEWNHHNYPQPICFPFGGYLGAESFKKVSFPSFEGTPFECSILMFSMLALEHLPPSDYKATYFCKQFVHPYWYRNWKRLAHFLNHTNLPPKPAKRVGETIHHSPATRKYFIIRHDNEYLVHHLAISTDTWYIYIY